MAARTKGKLDPSEVIIQSDHSHAGPDGLGVWGGVPTAYKRLVFDRTVSAIVRAYESRRPGRLRYGAVRAEPLLSNQFDYDKANQGVDDEVRVLQAVDGRGRAFASLVNFSAHTTVLGSGNSLASGDWVQAANPLLEKELGGEVVTMVGTLGRTQPRDHDCPDASLTGPRAGSLPDQGLRAAGGPEGRDRGAQGRARRRQAGGGVPLVSGEGPRDRAR